MKHIGLFEGIGGFSLAGRWMGWETVAWCEWDKNCQRVLKYHFPNAIPHDDIAKTDFTRYAGQIDILTGGFPCQPYSSAGKRLGKDDDRHLWPEMLRAIREIQPRWVVGENVRGLTNWNGGLVFDEVQSDLENEGYQVLPFLLPACAVDAPHRRDRIWFVAYKPEARLEGATRDGVQRSGNGFAGFCNAQNANEIRCNSFKPEGQPGEREQRVFSSGIDVRISDVPNASETGRKRSEQPGASQQGNGREQSPRPASKFHKIGDWQQFPTQSPLCSRNDGVPPGLDGITFPKWREFSIGAYGNAIVPQVAYQIFQAIQQMDNGQ